MLPLIEQEFVTRKKWVTKDEIVDIFAISQSIPGVISINSSLFVGYKIGKLPGAYIAAAGLILPSFFIILGIAALFTQFSSVEMIQQAFNGVRAGVTALILMAAIRLSKSVIKSKNTAIIALLSFGLLVFFEIHPIIIIVLSAISGLVLHQRKML